MFCRLRQKNAVRQNDARSLKQVYAGSRNKPSGPQVRPRGNSRLKPEGEAPGSSTTVSKSMGIVMKHLTIYGNYRPLKSRYENFFIYAQLWITASRVVDARNCEGVKRIMWGFVRDFGTLLYIGVGSCSQFEGRRCLYSHTEGGGLKEVRVLFPLKEIF